MERILDILKQVLFLMQGPFYYSYPWFPLFFTSKTWHDRNLSYKFIFSIASHSGWEDHFSSSQFHYLHHRFFECNYGSNSSPLDKIFGTFRDKLKESGTTYRGGSEEKVDAKSAAITDSKASLNSLPDLGFSIYMLINCTIWALLGLAVTQQVIILQSIYVFMSKGSFTNYVDKILASFTTYPPMLKFSMV